MNIEEEMSYVQKATEGLRAKMRLLWTILRTLESHGWETSSNPAEWLDTILLKAAERPESMDYISREDAAKEALKQAVEDVEEALSKLKKIDEHRIMKYGVQFTLNDVQDYLAKTNKAIKDIYDLRRGILQ